MADHAESRTRRRSRSLGLPNTRRRVGSLSAQLAEAEAAGAAAGLDDGVDDAAHNTRSRAPRDSDDEGEAAGHRLDAFDDGGADEEDEEEAPAGLLHPTDSEQLVDCLLNNY
jgi:hypothetical protein